MVYERLKEQPENPFSKLIPDQTIVAIPSFTLESGVTLLNVPVAYKSWGKLAPEADNAMVVCHAVSGSADVADWWGPLLGGPGRAFDITRFFVVCINSLGSPYGTASPVTSRDGVRDSGNYGPEFPLTTIRDDVRLSKLVLDDLGVRQIAAVVGGSMGGMMVLEFAYFGKDYVKTIVPIATSPRHSAWCISWGEGQRQAIYSDFRYDDGYYSYDEPPSTGLGAARMQALLTYRSRDSFESRFGRNTPDTSKRQNINSSDRPITPASEHFAIHNEGHRLTGTPRSSHPTGSSVPHSPTVQVQPNGASQPQPPAPNATTITDPQFHGATPLPTTAAPSKPNPNRPPTYFSAHSYLRHQGAKFIARFDANCYIALTRKLDTHDLSHHAPDPSSPTALRDALRLIRQPALVLGIESDGLFTFAEQREIAGGIANSRLEKIESPEGHDAFLLQFQQVNDYLLGFLRGECGGIFERAPCVGLEGGDGGVDGRETGADGAGVGKLVKSSVFGEAEVDDITAW